MPTSNDPVPAPARAAGAASRRRPVQLPGLVLVAATCLAAAGCGGGDTASLRRDVKLDVSHQPPGAAPAGAPFLLELRITSEPPLAPGSAHLWYLADGYWERLPLEALTGTDRLEAEVPAQRKGATLRYAFTVRTPFGEVLRLPSPLRGADAAPGAGVPDTAAASPPDTAAGSQATYELIVRGPVTRWVAWLRGAGAALSAALVTAGALLAFRSRSAEARGRPGLFAKLAAAGVLLFVAAGMTGAVAASLQSTGNLLRDVPTAWWIALAVWFPVLLVASRAPSGRSPMRAGMAWILVLAGVAGALLTLVGLLAAV